MEKYPIANVDALAGVDGGRKTVRVHDLELGIFRVADHYRAYLNVCPHAGAPLCAGPIHVVNSLPPEGSAQDETRRFVLRCPWHGWEFDLETGCHLHNHQCQLTSYPVEVAEDGTLFVLI